MTAAAIFSILACLVAIGATTYSSIASGLSSSNAKAVKELSSKITSQLGSRRLNLNKLLSYLTTNNTRALQNMLTANPTISDAYQRALANESLLAEISAKQATLEAQITEIKNDLSQNTYSQGIGEAIKSKADIQAKEAELQGKVQEYDNLMKQANEVSNVTKNVIAPNTQHIDSVSQNIKGGLN